MTTPPMDSGSAAAHQDAEARGVEARGVVDDDDYP